MNVALDLLDNTIPDLRRVLPTAEQDAAMLRTVQAKGVLQPILIRPAAGNRFEIVLGRRRTAAARAAGLTEIPAEVRAMTDAEAIEAQVIENLQRAQMHPIDQWRATKGMLDAGLTIADAALALGLHEREARRMELLAGLHPEVLALAEQQMPTARDLAQIATAAPEKQAATLKVRDARLWDDRINWSFIARLCANDRQAIARGVAIFDVEKVDLVWQEDLFAEPGAPDQFITYDVAGFMKAQRAALERRVADGRKKGERIALGSWRGHDVKVPAGWQRRYDIEVSDKPLKKPDGPSKFVAIGANGAIHTVIADPPPPLRRAPSAAQSTPGGAARPASRPASTAAPLSSQGAAVRGPAAAAGNDEVDEVARPPITQRGQQIIAAAKTAALHTRLREFAAGSGRELLPAFLVLALTAENVSAYRTKWGAIDLRDLRRRLIDPAGNLLPVEDGGLDLAVDVLTRILLVTDPTTAHGSGEVAEWIGNAIGADAALPRFDTEEFLETLSSAELRKLAGEAEVSVPKLVRELRTALVGKAPAWRPTTFGAPGPKPERRRTRLAEREFEEEGI